MHIAQGVGDARTWSPLEGPGGQTGRLVHHSRPLRLDRRDANLRIRSTIEFTPTKHPFNRIPYSCRATNCYTALWPRRDVRSSLDQSPATGSCADSSTGSTDPNRCPFQQSESDVGNFLADACSQFERGRMASTILPIESPVFTLRGFLKLTREPWSRNYVCQFARIREDVGRYAAESLEAFAESLILMASIRA